MVYSITCKDQSEANPAYSTPWKDRSEANSVYSTNWKDRSEANLFIPQIRKIETERTLFIPQIGKIEAKWSLFIWQIRKIEAERTLFIPQIEKYVMNSVSRKSLDLHHYKSGGHLCSLACPIMICSLLDVTHKEPKWRNGFFPCLESNLGLHKDVEYTETMCSRIFGWKTTKAYYSLWAGVASFSSCSLFMLLTGDVFSAMNWHPLREKPPSPQVL